MIDLTTEIIKTIESRQNENGLFEEVLTDVARGFAVCNFFKCANWKEIVERAFDPNIVAANTPKYTEAPFELTNTENDFPQVNVSELVDLWTNFTDDVESDRVNNADLFNEILMDLCSSEGNTLSTVTNATKDMKHKSGLAANEILPNAMDASTIVRDRVDGYTSHMDDNMQEYVCASLNAHPTGYQNCDSQLSTIRKELKPSVQGESPLNPSVCNQIFRQSATTKNMQFLKKATDENRYVCDVCQKTFKSLPILSNHKRRHIGEKHFVCDLCPRRFFSKSELSRHKKIHMGEKSFVCDVCLKAFRTSSDLSIHKRIHTDEFVCDLCPKAFLWNSHLLIHKRTHTGEKPFVCDLCPKACTTSSNLSKHKRIHTGEKPFVCDVCLKEFNQKASLSSHQKYNHGNFSCAHCGQSFSRKANLKFHLEQCLKVHNFQDRFEDHSKVQFEIV